MKTFHPMGLLAVGAVVAFAFVLAGCDSLFDDQIRPFEGPDFVEFGQHCPPNPTSQCYRLQVTDDAGTVQLVTNLIGPQRSSATEMRFRLVDRIFFQQASLQGQAGFTEVTGTSRATVVDDTHETIVQASVSNAAAGASLPWRVFAGTCAESGDVVGAAGAYPPLEVSPFQQATAEATLNVALEFGAPYHVRILASEGDMGTTVACGNLGTPNVIYETTAEADVHFSLPQGMSYTIPANSSFGSLQVTPIEGSVPTGQTVRLAIELLGAADGSIGPAGPGPERPVAHHMKFFNLVIGPS